MTGKSKFYLTLLAISILFISIQVLFLFIGKDTERSEVSLLNQYYALVKTDPTAAKRALDLVIEKNPTNAIARRELGYWYLRHNDNNSALQQFSIAHQINPNEASVSLEIARLYIQKGNYQRALPFVYEALKSSNDSIRNAAQAIYSQLSTIESVSLIDMKSLGNHEARTALRTILAANAPSPNLNKISLTKEGTASIFVATLMKMPQYRYSPLPTLAQQHQPQSTAGTMTERDKLLNAFYKYKKTDHHRAWQAIEALLKRYPNDIVALKEAGYFALSEENKPLALYYFRKAYFLTGDIKLALQTGYILDGLGQKVLAYYYFNRATQTDDLSERMKAEISLINLRSMQTQLLPYPFFADVYFTPFHFSRFKIVVYPLIMRMGFTANKKYNLNFYLIHRATRDNKSFTSGILSQIFNDESMINSIGVQFNPIPRFPVTVFAEAGKAIDLVYRRRARWRNDLRYGLALYKDWGYTPSYTFCPTFPFKFRADMYGDLIYYSRYLNTIGTLRVRPGFEVARYGSASVQVYYRGFIIQDQSRFFFNNLVEYGPGIAFTPSDRYNIIFCYENTKGHYLPAGNKASKNPYGNYHNNVYELDTYFRF